MSEAKYKEVLESRIAMLHQLSKDVLKDIPVQLPSQWEYDASGFIEAAARELQTIVDEVDWETGYFKP